MNRLFADAVLVLHIALAAFIVGALMCIIAGGLRRWGWIRNPWFRLAHLLAIAVVVAESWLGMVCPLTTLEMWLRAKSGGPTYEGAFIEHWLQSLLYYDAPPWVFIAAYSLFGALVAAAWWCWPPRRISTPPSAQRKYSEGPR